MRRLVVPVIAGLVLVGCGDAAANETCQDLQELEQRIIEADPDNTQLLTEIYDDVVDVGERTEGELGAALLKMQPVFEQFEALVGDDEQAAMAAQKAQAAQTEEEIAAINDAANYINETCKLSVLL